MPNCAHTGARNQSQPIMLHATALLLILLHSAAGSPRPAPRAAPTGQCPRTRDVDASITAPLPPKAAAELKGVCGVFEHGLFCGMTTSVIIAGKDGISQKP